MPEYRESSLFSLAGGALIAIMTALAWPSVASAGGLVASAKIAEIALNRTQGNFVFIRMQQAPSGAPACSNNGYWHFTLPLGDATAKNLYPVLLMAYAAQRNVKIQGTGTCTERLDLESLDVIFDATS